MSAADLFAVALLAVVGLVLGGVVGMIFVVRRHVRAQEASDSDLASEQQLWGHNLSRFTFVPYHPLQAQRPSRWLAIRSRDMQAVQLALGVHQAQSCTWSEGLFTGRSLFIAPPVNGWILVFGSDLPLPEDDVDEAYRLLRELSRKLGQVQFFQADSVLQHHAWVSLEMGRVVRAYAWAGTTIWNQGIKTRAEIDLRMNCFGYGDNPGSDDWTMADHIVSNVEQVPQLARRWSLDPADIDGRALAQQLGIAGRVARQ